MDMIISPILGWIPTYIIDPIRSRFRVLRNLRENIGELEKTAAKLDARKKDERAKLEEAKKQEGVEASAQAKLLFTQVDEDVSGASNLKTEYEQRRGSFSNCFSCCSGYQLSKRALKQKQDVEKLYEEEPNSGWTASSTSQKGKELDTVCIEGQITRQKLKDEIIDAVQDDRYVVVGLHATPNFVEIRKQIAKGFGSKCEDDKYLKEELYRLSRTRRYMLILDDMWDPVDLGDICIAAPKKENGCKILIASRSLSVVTRFAIRFEAKRSLQSIPVDKLQSDEAWNLFVEKVGEEITSRPEIKPLAKKVLRKCDGLPLVIIVIGATMSTRETNGEWEDGLRELEQDSNLEGIEEEDWNIQNDSLYECAIGEEILCDEMPKLGDVRNKVDVLVKKLKNSSMLEDSDRSSRVHDVMRAFGMWITSLTTTSDKFQCSHKYIVKARARITEAPDASKWDKPTKISLMWNEMESLPHLPHLGPQLHTLLLSRTRIKDIPQEHFLEQMHTRFERGTLKLKRLAGRVLSGLHKLEELYGGGGGGSILHQDSTLYIEDGSVMEAVSQLLTSPRLTCIDTKNCPVEIENVKNVSGHWLKPLLVKFMTKSLHLRKCGINSSALPDLLLLLLQEFPSFVKFTSCEGLTRVPTRGIESLSVRGCPDLKTLLMVEEDEERDNNNNITTAFESLRKLEVYGLDGLERICSSGVPQQAAAGCFTKLEIVEIMGCPNLKVLFTNIGVTRLLKRLWRLHVYRCAQLVNLVQVSEEEEEEEDLESILINNAFPRLEYIELCELPELRGICSSQNVVDLMKWPSLSSTKRTGSIHVYDCPKLRKPPFGALRPDILLHGEIDSLMTKVYLDYKKRKFVIPIEPLFHVQDAVELQ
ncbi:putative disease resistance protein At4g10780 [Telopea speciosissima]|uniref:putative disease resistance protein At4g10780 n=1 Tax=Telopea speciosissima TaxID=54955 RepID=UPI001CC64603|nr:putative disease resistance protein At4g10780 [Telopea speciosissima]